MLRFVTKLVFFINIKVEVILISDYMSISNQAELTGFERRASLVRLVLLIYLEILEGVKYKLIIFEEKRA